MLQPLSNYLKWVLSQLPAKEFQLIWSKGTFFKAFFRENISDFTDLHNEKINLEVSCKRNHFGYWNSCKHLPNFVNVAALVDGCLP